MAQLKTALSDIERDIPVAPQKASNGLSAARNEVAGTQEERDEINARICAEEGLTGAGYPTKDAAGTNAYLAGAKEMIERMKEESVETRKRIAKTESAVETAATVLQRELAKGKSIEEARAAARKAVLNQHAEAASAGGLIGDSSWADPYAAVETARQAPNGSAWTPQAIAKREAAQQRVSKLGAAIEGDTLQNALRVRFGQAPVSVDGDALYELLEGKK
ncbi:hypothetical protein [Paraburkholderia sp. BL10I2N1]|uniref:hypothetical protein n=1 Tax=Paraburkholderia sp. BL10I2N1 TaxID=1938796 RepID=UPI00105CB34C|nr:hypothetical protein [Paraburkholderia sp. BL10I2N1]